MANWWTKHIEKINKHLKLLAKKSAQHKPNSSSNATIFFNINYVEASVSKLQKSLEEKDFMNGNQN